MKVWQLAYPHNLQHVDLKYFKENKFADNEEKTENDEPSNNTHETLSYEENDARSLKIKVTKALVSEMDVAVYSGAIKVKMPFIPGRFAIGTVVSDNKECFIQKGERVYFAGISENEEAPDGLLVAGENTDGFYRDFVETSIDDVYPLPPTVSDEAAFLVDAVAMAEHIIDEMNIGVGQHVLVSGGGLYGNVLCQILIYHRAVPILIDNNAERLQLAKKCGIYYTFPNDETLKTRVLEVTGGKMADGAAYLAFANRCEPSILFSLVKRDASVAFSALVEKPIHVNIENALKNNVTIKGITESREFVPTAINLLANKAVNFSFFPIKTYREEELPRVMEEFARILGSGANLPEELDIIKFLF